MIRYLRDGGRAAIVLPDGSLTGDGVKERIREEFLKQCNVHTIVRLPNSGVIIKSCGLAKIA